MHEAVGHGPADEAELAFARRVESLPKRERHVHLEAAVPLAFYHARARTPDAAGRLAQAGPPYSDLMQFIRSWVTFTTQMRTLADIEALVVAGARARAEQNIVETDFHVSLLDHSHFRSRMKWPAEALPLQGLFEALHAGAVSAEAQYPQVRLGFIVDAVYPSLPEERADLLGHLRTHFARHGNSTPGGRKIIVGVGLGGPERLDDLAGLARFLDSCRELGLYVDVHSGESADAAGHKRAVQILKPQRIGHGIAAAAEGWFFQEGHLSACPLSNLVTNAWPGALAAHPLKAMLAAGCDVSLNSDDPILFGNTLTLDCVAARRVGLASEGDIISMVRAGKIDRGVP